MAPTSQQSTIDIDGRRLSFLAAGDQGPPVLLLHGFGADRLSWLLTQREAASFGRTAALDLPGHGQSDPEVGEGSVADFADLTARFVETQFDEPVHMVGHSLGGAIAIDLAHRRPDLVASLFLLAPAGVGSGIDPDFLAAVTGMETLEQASAVLGRLVTRARLISPQMTTRALAQISQPGTRDALRKVAGNLVDVHRRLAPAVSALAASPLPKALVWGDSDTINPLAADGAASLGAALHVVEGAGHLPHIEGNAEVNALLRAFLAEACGPRP
jgi:pimeloyl-ACP methyl ester carboxylesterase